MSADSAVRFVDDTNSRRNRSPVLSPDGIRPQSDGTDTAAGAVTDSSSSSSSSQEFVGCVPAAVPSPVWASLGFPEPELAGIDTLTRSLAASTSSDADTTTSACDAEVPVVGPVNVTVDPDSDTPAGDPDSASDRSAPTAAPENPNGTPSDSPCTSPRFSVSRSVAVAAESPSDASRSGADSVTDVASSSDTATVPAPAVPLTV